MTFSAPAPQSHNTPSPDILVHAARLSYGGDLLFDHLDARFPGGRCTCLLGPSGVGKSSLLRLIAGLAPPGAGGEVIGGDGAPVTGRVAWMGQTEPLMPWLSARGNVAIGPRLRGEGGYDAASRRADALLTRVGLAGRERDRPATLSGGMRQRVALARTLFEDRPFVLMDEPFSALDAITRFALQEEAARHLAGRTVLLVTHDPLEALRLGHVVHVMAGRPAILGAPITPPGDPPRDLKDARLLALQGELLDRLAHAAAAA
ncbi:MAG: ABC transporter ATP-binding protein [Alphaproteobacteria bacterium]|nr:ABC transporter ATP-binding protein [Alphaproteobacteria bacterium]